MITAGLKSATRGLSQQQISSAARASSTTSTCCSIPRCASSRHQRRHSSGKASCPPGDSSDGSRATTAPSKAPTAANSPEQQPTAAIRQSRPRQSRVKRGKSEQPLAKAAETHTQAEEWMMHLPRVPDTSKMSESDLKLSSLFAMHRPLSLDKPLPPHADQEAFDKIFEPPTAAHPADVVETLSNTIETLEGRRVDGDLRWQVVQESPSNTDNSGVRHLDGRYPRPMTTEQAVSQFKPYLKPQPPVPFSEADQSRQQRLKTSPAPSVQQYQPPQKPSILKVLSALQGKKQADISSDPEQSQPQSRSQMQAALFAHQENEIPSEQPLFFSPNAAQPRMTLGRRRRMFRPLSLRYGSKSVFTGAAARDLRQGTILFPASTPMARRAVLIRIPLPVGAARIRRAPSRGEQGVMRAISVRRQRKLKMKKHKYKKLMKRTRTLRRKLDR